MTKILALETSSSACSVAVFDSSRAGNDQYQMLHKHVPMQQARFLLPMIHTLLAQFALDLTHLDAIAYGCGPGSFTGIRLASSTAQAIGYGLDLPLIPISSLAAMAKTAFNDNRHWQNIIVCVDARLGQVYWANYQLDDSGDDDVMTFSDQEMIFQADQIPKIAFNFKENECYGVGDGWEKYEKSIMQTLGFVPHKIIASIAPTAIALLELARIRFQQKQFVEAKNALPVYLK